VQKFDGVTVNNIVILTRSSAVANRPCDASCCWKLCCQSHYYTVEVWACERSY